MPLNKKKKKVNKKEIELNLRNPPKSHCRKSPYYIGKVGFFAP